MRAFVKLAIIAATVLSPAVGTAQLDPSLDRNLDPSSAWEPFAPGTRSTDASWSEPIDPQAPNVAWGSQAGLTWIAATQFTGRLNAAAPQLTYAIHHYYSSPGAATPNRYFAQLDMEPGLLVESISCVFNDPSPTNDIHVEWQRYTTETTTGTTATEVLGGFTSSGSFGYTNVIFSPPGGPVTMSTANPPVNLINHYLVADIAGDTSLAGCWAGWRRQVAPGPLSATFNDVPPSSPWFRYVEALVDTGVTSGCGAGNYCPNSPITRGQMAVFLAKALGMGFPF